MRKCEKSTIIYRASIFGEWRGWYAIKFEWKCGRRRYMSFTLYDNHNNPRVSGGDLEYVLTWIE